MELGDEDVTDQLSARAAFVYNTAGGRYSVVPDRPAAFRGDRALEKLKLTTSRANTLSHQRHHPARD